MRRIGKRWLAKMLYMCMSMMHHRARGRASRTTHKDPFSTNFLQPGDVVVSQWKQVSTTRGAGQNGPDRDCSRIDARTGIHLDDHLHRISLTMPALSLSVLQFVRRERFLSSISVAGKGLLPSPDRPRA